MAQKVNFTLIAEEENGTLTYEGTADYLTVKNDYDEVDSMYHFDRIAISQRTSLTLENVQAKGKWNSNKTKGIEHTARVLGWEDPEAAVNRKPTIALIKAAAEKAGVDENTDFELIYEWDVQRSLNKVYVEFRWTE